MKSLSAQNIVLLGASSDIGRVLLRRAQARSSVRIVAVSRRKQRSPSKSACIVMLDGVDLTQEEHLKRLAKEVARHFREPFSIVHSVGEFWRHKPLVRTPYAEIETMLRSQVLTLLGVARFLTPLLIRNGGGRLVAFSCNSVSYNYPDMAPFTSSKAAIESFVKCYANEHSKFHIAATALALSTIRTRAVAVEKPTGDQKNYLTPIQLADYILDHVLTAPLEENGNVTKLFKYSPTFYHKSYYDRNPITRSFLRSGEAKRLATSRS